MSDETPDTPTDLSFATTEELITELAKRHDGLIVAWENNLTTTKTEFFCEWRGALTLAIGLASRAHARLIQVATDRPIPKPEQ